MAEFPLSSSKEQLFKSRKPPSADGSHPAATAQLIDQSITKDKCTVQTFRADMDNQRDSSGRDNTTSSSWGSSEFRDRRFNTSSYQQRAEALEGMLEFSAQLLQQERYMELGILLKLFGPVKVSPRETAICLTKSFKETGL